LSSGSKLVSPEDDAAGLAVSTRFEAQINRLSAASSNIGNAISFSQTQDGFLKKVSKALDRMSELSVLAQDATKGSDDLDAYDTEFTKLKAYITDLSDETFNSVALFDANSNLAVTTDSEGTGTFTLDAVDLTAVNTAVTAIGALADAAAASTAQGTIATQIQAVANARATVGANLSVLNSYNDQLGVLKDNLSSANSRIKDVDVAEESAEYARYNILVQAGTAMLAQANQSNSGVMRLLQ
jgi:flagellin